ncbi:MAG: PRTRC system ThiF family protein [Tannerellaceae bacterium]
MKRVHFVNNYLLNPTHPITVTLIGVGGTGSQVLTGLARINHALVELGRPGLHVVAYDPDIVTEANVGRQLFSLSDVGLNKASVLVTRINRFFGTSWKSEPRLFCTGETSRTNIYISCVDSAKARLFIEDSLRRSVFGYDHTRKMYWLDFGNTVNSGQVVLGTLSDWDQPKSAKFETVSKMPTVTEMFDLTKVDDADSGPSCSLAEALRKQDLFINSTLADIGLALLWKLLTETLIDYRGAYINLNSMLVNPIKL